jgi:hypothetical protein
MNRKILVFSAAALLLATSLAGAQQQVSRVTDDELINIDVAIRGQLRLLADSALAAGLPADMILQTGRRGKMLGSQNSVVVQAATRQLRDMHASSAALGAGATGADIEAGVDALRSGVTPQTLGRLAAENKGTALYVSLGVLSELVELRVPVDTAVRIVTRLAAMGIRDTDLRSYRASVQSDIALGALPSAAATIRAEAASLRGGNTGVDVGLATSGPGTRAATGRDPIPPEEN